MMTWYIAGAICACTLGGGGIAWWWKDQRGLVLGFCAGALTAGALGEIPELLELLDTPDSPWHPWHLLGIYGFGFVCCALLEWRIPFEPAEAGMSLAAHMRHLSIWVAVAIVIPSTLDSMALAQEMQIGEPLGWRSTLAVLLHQLADGIITVGVMLSVRQTLRATKTILAVAACTPSAGLAISHFAALSPPTLALSLAWFSGIFLYLGTLSFLPAARALSPSRWFPYLMAGAAFIGGIQWLGT
jgi:ZIP family zinc transporter